MNIAPTNFVAAVFILRGGRRRANYSASGYRPTDDERRTTMSILGEHFFKTSNAIYSYGLGCRELAVYGYA